MKITIRGLSLALASVGMLTIYGCGGGSSGDTPPTVTSMTVAPSLGKFSKGTSVKLKRIDLTQLASGSIGDDGKAILTFTGYAGPIVVEVLGGADVQYYDEGTKALATFGAGKTLRAVAPAAQAVVGVTALTNAAVVKLEAATGGIAVATVININDANAKVGSALGMGTSSILDAPTLVDIATGKTLDVATVGDKYALVLAALAKIATGTSTAVDVADALARDLKDDQLDGLDSTSTAPTTAIANAPTNAALISNYTAAAADLATATTVAPLVPNPNVSTITASYLSDLGLAKAMFAELRTTLNSFSNGSTGFLDTQATRMNADLNANVAPELAKVASRVGTLAMAMAMFEDGKAYTSNNTFGLMPTTDGSALVRQSGSPDAAWYGYGSFDYCRTDSATGVASKVTCSHFGQDSADRSDPTNPKFKYIVYELTGTASNQYNYTATRYNRSVAENAYGGIAALGTPTLASVPAGNGTLTKTVSGTTMTGLTINGTLPPSATNASNTLSTGVDTIAISAARSALTAANNFRYALSGSVATTNLADASKVVTLSLDNGSYFDSDETASATGGTKVLAVKLVGTAKTTATKFTGTLDVGAFSNNADGFDYSPTSIVFNGSISDTSTGGAGEMLTGKLEAAVADYKLYHSTQPQSGTNYQKATVTFTGTVQAPSRPALKLVVAAVKTGIATSNITVDYSYGTVKITGSGATSATGNTLTLSNQDGVQVVLNSQSAGTVTKSGATLATIGNGMVNYTDGVSESLN
ncbi:MAG: hypothetical protein GZ093_14130 [Rhodoferax sp.]|uniref:hypothetical protein n=1 Tax=Rhodoferax sp. TaxID=50421 RepID=UPI001400124B|nr:hypothetical protein [Rhodoferax sp.]NDP39865.1 hypothetical protein [Rhodoferax sp.]